MCLRALIQQFIKFITSIVRQPTTRKIKGQNITGVVHDLVSHRGGVLLLKTVLRPEYIL